MENVSGAAASALLEDTQRKNVGSTGGGAEADWSSPPPSASASSSCSTAARAERLPRLLDCFFSKRLIVSACVAAKVCQKGHERSKV